MSLAAANAFGAAVSPPNTHLRLRLALLLSLVSGGRGAVRNATVADDDSGDEDAEGDNDGRSDERNDIGYATHRYISNNDDDLQSVSSFQSLPSIETTASVAASYRSYRSKCK